MGHLILTISSRSLPTTRRVLRPEQRCVRHQLPRKIHWRTFSGDVSRTTNQRSSHACLYAQGEFPENRHRRIRFGMTSRHGEHFACRDKACYVIEMYAVVLLKCGPSQDEGMLIACSLLQLIRL